MQPLLASEDYEAFKAMMVQKNADLEYQALELLQKRLGQSPGVYQPRDPNATPSPTLKDKVAKQEAQEEKELQDALRLSLEESDSKRMEEEEMERLLEQAIQESLKLHQMQTAAEQQGSSEREEKRKGSDASLGTTEKPGQGKDTGTARETQPIAEKCQVQTSPEEPKLPNLSGSTAKHSLIPLNVVGSESGAPAGGLGGEVTGEEAAQLWIQSAKSELESRHSPLAKQRALVG